MIEIIIPGHKTYRLKHLVLDYNGTLARDGQLLPLVKERLGALAEKLNIHVLTADTFGKAEGELNGIPCQLSIVPAQSQEQSKLQYVKCLGSALTVCIGNGRNDRLMLKAAGLGITVVLEEGAATESLLAGDVVCTSIIDALGLLENPLRLVATLRS